MSSQYLQFSIKRPADPRLRNTGEKTRKTEKLEEEKTLVPQSVQSCQFCNPLTFDPDRLHNKNTQRQSLALMNVTFRCSQTDPAAPGAAGLVVTPPPSRHFLPSFSRALALTAPPAASWASTELIVGVSLTSPAVREGREFRGMGRLLGFEGCEEVTRNRSLLIHHTRLAADPHTLSPFCSPRELLSSWVFQWVVGSPVVKFVFPNCG